MAAIEQWRREFKDRPGPSDAEIEAYVSNELGEDEARRIRAEILESASAVERVLDLTLGVEEPVDAESSGGVMVFAIERLRGFMPVEPPREAGVAALAAAPAVSAGKVTEDHAEGELEVHLSLQPGDRLAIVVQSGKTPCAGTRVSLRWVTSDGANKRVASGTTDAEGEVRIDPVEKPITPGFFVVIVTVPLADA